jgi:molybdopterin-guanine dinucleotide biosynthesis protein A
LVPPDLVKRLYHRAARDDVQVVVAHDGQRLQPVFSLVHRDLLPDLMQYLVGGERKIDRWLERHSWRQVDFSDCREMFLNVNTPKDLELAGTWSSLEIEHNSS